MPRIDTSAICDVLRAAAAANGSTPGRRGSLIDLQDAAEVMVAGDMHGNRANFKRLVRRAGLDRYPKRHLVIQELVHGGPRTSTGGDRSYLLVERACQLKVQYPERVHILLGNHELAEWTSRRIGKRGEDMNLMFRMGLATAFGSGAYEVDAALKVYYASLPVVIRTSNRVGLSHSVPPPGSLKNTPLGALAHRATDGQLRIGGLIHSICWSRGYTQRRADRFAEWLDVDLLVTGHEPSPDGWSCPNRRQLIVDCCRSPAAYVLFETGRRLTIDELLDRVEVL